MDPSAFDAESTPSTPDPANDLTPEQNDLTPEQWAEVGDLFDRLCDLAPDEQDARLDDLDSPVVASALRRLLVADREAPSFLEGNAFDVLGTEMASSAEVQTAFPDPPTPEGTRVGAYRILERIGRGGMGNVYLAERADGAYEQRVALKQVRGGGLDGPDLIARFRRERQILAGLQHENVARLLDGGVDDHGRPYLVMEYVEGERIDIYCNERALGIDGRLDLFRQVAQAVSSAHRRTVIHRDIKPSNVLVCEPEEMDRPLVKLLDFGIAKLLSPNLSEGDGAVPEPLTQTGSRLMTPEYAAPEQIADEEITTATDVYQLGTLLYELLTGRHPYESATGDAQGRARMRAVEDAVLQGTPARPSGAATRLTDEEAQRTHGVDPAVLQRQLRGDLDAIVLKALRREPEARYASVDALLDDLDRYAKGRPVDARRDSGTYRMRKWIERNWLVGTVAAVFVGVLALWAITATQQAQEVQAALDQARSEAAQKEEVSNLFLSILEMANPDGTVPDTITVRQLLDRGRELTLNRLQDRPRLQAQFAIDLGMLYHRVGDYRAARTLADTSLMLRRKLYDTPDANLAESYQLAAMIRSEMGDYRAADTLFQAGLVQWNAIESAPSDIRYVRFNMEYAGMLREIEDLARAESLLTRAVRIGQSNFGDHRDVALALHSLGLLRTDLNQFQSAESLYVDALSMWDRLTTGPDFEKAKTLNSFGYLMKRQGRYDEAATYYQRALNMRRTLLGSEHPDLSYSLNNLGALYRSLGNLERSERMLRKALAISINSLGEVHTRVAKTRLQLGFTLMAMDRLEEARPQFTQAIDVHTTIYGEGHLTTVDSRVLYATFLTETGEMQRAEAILKDVIPTFREHLPETKSKLAGSLYEYGKLLVEVGRVSEAIPRFREARQMRIEVYGADDRRVKDVEEYLQKYAGASYDQGDTGAG